MGTYAPNVAETAAWIDLWGRWALLVVAGVTALALARELWPLIRLRLVTRNELIPGRRVVAGVVEAGAVDSPIVVEIDQERRHWSAHRSRTQTISEFRFRLVAFR